MASADPLAKSVILWTRVTPEDDNDDSVAVDWFVYKDAPKNPVVKDTGEAKRESDFTLKVDIQDLEPGTKYRYFFRTQSNEPTIGITRTLPTGSSNTLKMVVLSCSNYPAGITQQVISML